MLIRFSVENFLSFDEKQQLIMIPNKRIETKREHLISLDQVSLLRIATIYGANASGKSNLIEAIGFTKSAVTNKLPLNSINKYCRVKKQNENRNTKFEVEIYKNNRYYAYGFSLDLHKQLVVAEWLYELFPHKAEEKMLFEREAQKDRMELGSDLQLSEIDEMRFKTYKLDFGENKSSLFITEMNRNKNISSDSKLSFFKDVYDWFENDLAIILPDHPITTFDYFYGYNCKYKIDEIIKSFDTGISNVKIHEISLVEFRDKLSPKIANDFLELFKNKLSEATMGEEVALRDEIWFVERNNSNISHLYSLDRFNERYDKKLSKAYLEGRYGAIPIFGKYPYEDGEC